MNRLKVNKVIMYIKAQNEFPFDVLDVQDEFSKVLRHYCLQGHLNWNEQDVLQEELLKLAEAAQTAEVARMVHRELDLEGGRSMSRNVKIEQSVGFLDWLVESSPRRPPEEFLFCLGR